MTQNFYLDLELMSAIDQIAPKHSFAVGDEVLLTYRRKKRLMKVPVVIAELIPPYMSGDVSGAKRKSIDEPSYVVRSAGGGTLHVGASALKPGTVLDRIVDAIGDDEL